MLPFPSHHKEITQQLLNGKFILPTDSMYNEISSNKDIYIDFFKQTFDYELVITANYSYLKSSNEKDKSSRDFLIFMALLCRELDKDGKDFKKEVEEEIFIIEDIAKIFAESSKKEIIESTSMYKQGAIDLPTFLDTWNRRNVINYEGGKQRFRFTKAVGLFFDFATTLANEKLKEDRNSKPSIDIDINTINSN